MIHGMGIVSVFVCVYVCICASSARALGDELE